MGKDGFIEEKPAYEDRIRTGGTGMIRRLFFARLILRAAALCKKGETVHNQQAACQHQHNTGRHIGVS